MSVSEKMKRSDAWRRAMAAFAIVVAGTCAQGAWAACKRLTGVTEFIVNLDMGSIVIPPGKVVGDVLAEKRFYPVAATQTVARCTNGGSIQHQYLQGSPVAAVADTYSTNVQGIGIRIKYYEGDGPYAQTFYYPNTGTVIGQRDIERRSTSYYEVAFIKTEPITGTGAITSGKVAAYSDNYYNDLGVIFVPANGVTVVTPTCEIDTGSRNILVQLGKVPAKNFSGVGSTAGTRPFNIQLNCTAGAAAANMVYLRMDATLDPSGQQGVLQLTQGAGVATGVGIQVLDRSGVAVKFGEDALVGPSKQGDYVLPYTARYLQTAPDITAGPANGVATFVVNYK